MARTERGPLRAVEFGSFVGYSAMRVAKHLPGGSKFTCVEPAYADPRHKQVVDTILSWALLDQVVAFQPVLSYNAIDQFERDGTVFDIVITDHLKQEYLPTLQLMISKGQLRPGALFLADNIVRFNIIDLLRYLRFSKEFDDYRLYYTFFEYNFFQNDAVVTATYVGSGHGRSFDSPNATVCSDFTDCEGCLANLCAWCVGVATCVPDVEDRSSYKECGSWLGVWGNDIQCPEPGGIEPKSWIGPRNETGMSRRGGVPVAADKAKFLEQWTRRHKLSTSGKSNGKSKVKMTGKSKGKTEGNQMLPGNSQRRIGSVHDDL
eukprot:gnl/MRDRNA2_/MRDRNA2_16792_c0_seq1.p1 gnl/MRDRNA2_/MRDRNA2_16792_c0~~gnl/MRDRNA2_/MRDRNA2_16792_c0_seq1.p1  ORF type:complete len:319 (+),score=25.66 gnl/MRDRNA2_/MRDRNA2_16792_c0_seq1:1-957(+)